MNYYNEIDPYAAQWLENLIQAGHLPRGDVDRRSIVDVVPSDLAGYTQCHFFAGIGVWSYALRLAGWPDDRPVWTGSCPCQPFSAAGKRGGFDDERHLWPVFYRLIAQCRPPVVLGEQVASSLVVGRRADADVLGMWDRARALGIREDWLQGNLPFHLQGLPELGGAGVGDLAAEFDAIARQQARCVCEGAGGEQGGGVRSDAGMAAGETGQRSVRSERVPVRHDGGERMGDAFSGPHPAGTRVREEQHASGAVCPECGLRKLGGAPHHPDRHGDHGAEEAAIRAAFESLGGELEAADGAAWLSTVQVDLEREGYAFGATVLPACGVGAPHIRQRLWWVGERLADASAPGLEGQDARAVGHERPAVERGVWSGRLADALHPQRRPLGVDREDGRHGPDSGREEAHGVAGTRGEVRRLGHAHGERQGPVGGVQRGTQSQSAGGGEPCGLADADGREPRQAGPVQSGGEHGQQQEDGGTGRLADADVLRARPEIGSGHDPLDGQRAALGRRTEQPSGAGADGRDRHGDHRAGRGGFDASDEMAGVAWPGPTDGFWRDADWLFCRDGKWRPVEPGTFPLAHGAPARVGRLRAYGNAIVAQAAAEFIGAVMECQP